MRENVHRSGLSNRRRSDRRERYVTSEIEPDGVRAIRSVDYIIVLCEDLTKMRSFYAEVLQLRVHDEEPGHWVGFQVGSLFIALRPRGRSYDGPAIADESASIQLSFRVPPADVDIAFHTLQEHGVDIIEQPTNQDFPHRTLFFRDPENNVIEIFAEIHPRDTAPKTSTLHRKS